MVYKVDKVEADWSASKINRGPSQTETLRHLRPINGLSGLLSSLTGPGVPPCVNGSSDQLIGSTDEIFKPIGDRRRSYEDTATVRSRAVQIRALSGLQRALLDQMLKLLKPIEGLSDLLRALTGYQGNLSGQRNALPGSKRHVKADMAERRPFR